MNSRGPLATWIAGALGVSCLAVAATACTSVSSSSTKARVGAHRPTATQQTKQAKQTKATTPPPGSTGRGSAGGPATKIVYLAPVDRRGNLVGGLTVSGSAKAVNCGADSETVATATAYRCFTDPTIYDPCWVASGAQPTFYCMNAPWSKSVTKVTDPSLEHGTGAPPLDTTLDHPWGVQLTDGKRCIATQGARLVVGKDYGAYACGFAASDLELLDSPNRSGALWTFRTVYFKGDTIMHGPTVKVAVAWYGEAHE